MGFHQTAISNSFMGVAPLRRSAEALPIACDALNARTMAVREYHYTFCAIVAHNAATLVLGCGVGRSFPKANKLAYREVVAHPARGSAQKECI